MKLKLSKVKANYILFSVCCLVGAIAFKDNFFSNALFLVLFGILSFISYELGFLIFIFGCTGFMGLQMNGTNDVAVVAVIALTLRCLIGIRNNYCQVNKLWRISIIGILLLSISAFVAYFRFGQPISLGLLVDRVVLELLIFPLYYSLKKKNIGKLVEHLNEIAPIFSCMLIIQYIVMNSVIFLPVQQATRAGGIMDRILIHNAAPLLVFLSAYCLMKILDKQGIRYVISMVLYTIELFVVAQGRMIEIIYLIVILTVFYLYGKNSIGKIMMRCVSLILLSAIGILMYQQIQSLIYVKFYDMIQSGDNYVRIREIKAYFGEIDRNVWLGAGSYNSKYTIHPFNRLTSNRLFSSDIGVFGDFVTYGFVIVICISYAVIYLMKAYRTLNNKSKKLSMIIILIEFLVGMWSIPILTYIPLFLIAFDFTIQQKRGGGPYGKNIAMCW